MAIEWSLVLFTAISGAGAWLFVASALGELSGKGAGENGEDNATAHGSKLALPGVLEALVALVLVAVGGVISVTHLAHPDRIINALSHPTSGICLEAAFVGVISLALVVYLLLKVRGASAGAIKAVAVIGLLLGVVFSFSCGFSYMMAARPTWNTLALPLAYLGTAAAAGTALNLLIKMIQKRGQVSLGFAGLLSLLAGAVGIVTALVFVLGAGEVLFGGEGQLSIWVIALFVALAVVCAIGALYFKSSSKSVGFAALSVCGGLVGVVALRVVMWLTGTGVLDFFGKI
jgi:anaerobic dimethyl sulfoxide reductase subunit C (anchor subunit)